MRLILGGWSPFMRRAAKKYADEWNLWNGTQMDFKRIKQQVKNKGRRIELSRAGLFFLAETSKKLQRKLNAESRRLKELNLPISICALRKHEVFCGDTDEFISQMKGFTEAGVDRFYFDILNPNDKHMVDLLTMTLRNEL
jgi:alkanesulfonate monooxygenase SsuD/methylene tetrahydromethanopterin reductase-like flavin-dependent oxidoreductase (luciferase family)